MGVILSTPEYHGSYSSVIKRVIENLGFPSARHKKPVALLGVAAGRIGAIKSLEHLQGICVHVGALVLPASASGCRDVFDEEGRATNPQVEEIVRGLATNLTDYIHEYVIPGLCMEEMIRHEKGGVMNVFLDVRSWRSTTFLASLTSWFSRKGHGPPSPNASARLNMP